MNAIYSGGIRAGTLTPQSNRQYVAVEFNPWDRRSYTYHNDGAPVSVGDKVRVETRDGSKTVTVVSLPEAAPAFETKPILGPAAAAFAAAPSD